VPEHSIEYLPPSAILSREREWRTHPPEQLKALRASIQERGVVEPPLIDSMNRIVCGGLTVEAARAERLNSIPVLRIEHMTDDELRLYAIGAARIAAMSGYDETVLADEFRELGKLLGDLDLAAIGMAQAEFDRILALTSRLETDDTFEEGDPVIPVSRIGDAWLVADSKLFHGDSLEQSSFERLMGEDRASFILSDVPYNLSADQISGNGKHQHGNFVQGAGEFTPPEFTRFLTRAMRLMQEFSTDGSLHAFFMSYHFLLELMRAGNVVFGRPKAMCTWVKRQGGMGSLFRSQTEFIVYYKNGKAPHTNNIMLGKHGRNRSSAWFYDGMNSFSDERDELLALHATPKPVPLLQDAILDVTRHGEIVLDPFAGSGSIILAAEAAGRRARAIELDGRYVDGSIRRVQRVLGAAAIRENDGASFDDLAAIAASKAMEAANV